MRINPNANAGSEFKNESAEQTTDAASAAPVEQNNLPATNQPVLIAGLQPDKVVEIMKATPEMLQLNQNSVNKAIEYGKSLLDRIEAEGMSAELDALCNNYLVRIKKTVSDVNTRRTPATQLLAALAKEFTSLEALIDVDKPQTVAGKVQEKRNAWAKAEAERIRIAEVETNRKLQAEKEKVQIKADAEAQINKHFNDHLSNQLFSLQSHANGLTLENYETRLQALHEFKTAYEFAHFDNFIPRLMPIYLKQEELQNIVTNAKLGKYETFAKEFADKIVTKRMELIDRMPSQFQELKFIADEAEKQRLQTEELRKKDAAAAAARDKEAAVERERTANIQREREAAAALQLEKEKQERESAAAMNVEINRATEMTGALFGAQMELAEIEKPAAKIKESYEIAILNPLAFSLLLSFYLEKEGKTEAVEKLGKKTLNSLKKFAEDWAIKNNDEKINSVYIRYDEKYKAVTTK